MKKILTGFVFCLSITSCSLDTIPTSQYVEDNFWKTPEQIEAGLVACYNTMYNVYMSLIPQHFDLTLFISS